MLGLLETRCSAWFAICCIAQICMTDVTNLISFLLILFHYWGAFVEYQQNWVNNTTWNFLTNIFSVNHIQIGSFRDCSRIGLQKCSPFLNSVTPILQWWMMKLSTVIPYLKEIENIYKSRDTPIKFCWISIFSPKISNFSYIKKYRHRLHFNTWLVILLTMSS